MSYFSQLGVQARVRQGDEQSGMGLGDARLIQWTRISGGRAWAVEVRDGHVVEYEVG